MKERTLLGKFLAYVRIDRNLTQTQMAEHLGISRVYLSYIEKGNKPVSKRLRQSIIINYADAGCINGLKDLDIIINRSNLSYWNEE